MKKTFLVSGLLIISLIGCSVYAAKYKVNSSGTVRTNGNQVVPKVNSNNTQNYNIYQSQSYVNQNQVNNGGIKTIEFVMDYSGSMYNWIDQAKRTMSSIIAQIPSSASVGFRVFGHDDNGKNPNNATVLGQVNKIVKENGKYKVQTSASAIGSIKGYCSATKQVARIATANTNSILAGMNSVNSGGATPLVYALDRTVNEDFSNFDKTTPKKIVLITDGGENCGGNPCEYAKQLMKNRSDIHVDVVLVTNTSDMNLRCLANVTGGKMYRITNLSEFLPAITQSLSSDANQESEPEEQYYEYYEE